MNKSLKQLRVALPVLVGFALVAVPAAAFAREDAGVGASAAVNPHVIMMVHPQRHVFSPAVVRLDLNGNASVSGAKVTGVSSSTVSAQTSWGSAVINWTVVTGSSTQLLGDTTFANIHVGDPISFSGSIDQSAGAFTIDAKTLRDGIVPAPHPWEAPGATSTIMEEGSATTSVGFWGHLKADLDDRFGISL